MACKKTKKEIKVREMKAFNNLVDSGVMYNYLGSAQKTDSSTTTFTYGSALTANTRADWRIEGWVA